MYTTKIVKHNEPLKTTARLGECTPNKIWYAYIMSIVHEKRIRIFYYYTFLLSVLNTTRFRKKKKQTLQICCGGKFHPNIY